MSLKTLKINKGEKLFISSDYHLNHHNIIKYDERPFKDVRTMNEEIFRKHNETVGPDDYFIYLGDFTFGRDPEKAKKDWMRLNGKKFYVFGNHDKTIMQNRGFFNPLDLLTVKKEDPDSIRKWQDIVLCHYAMRVWNKSHHGAWHLYGHSHGSLPDDPNSLSFDVGIMLNNYYPWEYEEIKRRMATKDFKPIDHHK